MESQGGHRRTTSASSPSRLPELAWARDKRRRIGPEAGWRLLWTAGWVVAGCLGGGIGHAHSSERYQRRLDSVIILRVDTR